MLRIDQRFYLLAGLLLAGCGGGGSSSFQQTGKISELTFRARGTSTETVFHSADERVTVDTVVADAVTGLTQVAPLDSSSLADTRLAVVVPGSLFEYTVSSFSWTGGPAIPVGSAQLPRVFPTQVLPALSPDWSTLAFVAVGPPPSLPGSPDRSASRDPSDYNQIYRASLNDTEPIALTASDGSKEMPIWSADGRTLAFEKSLAPGSNGFDIFTVPTSGGTETRITHDGIRKSELSWSPAGDRIAYIAEDTNHVSQIYTVKLTNGAVTQMTFDADDKALPAWSPDGKYLAFENFSGYSEGDRFSLMMLPLEGGLAKILVRTAYPIHSWTWSPDGSEIAYISGDLTSGIFTIPFYGGAPHQVSTSASLPYASNALYWARRPGTASPPRSVHLLGVNGLLVGEMGAYLASSINGTVTSVIAFDTISGTADSRKAVAIGQGGPLNSLYLTIHSPDGFRRISYINYTAPYTPGPVQTVDMATNLKGLRIVFDPRSGTITQVYGLP